MPDDQTVAAPDDQQRIIDQMLQQALNPPRAATATRSRTDAPSTITGLLGSALGGGPSGTVPLSGEEADASGNRALLSFGLNLLANSGYSTDRKTIGQLIGGGIGAAQQSLGQSEYMKAARGQAQQDYAAQQQELQIARVKEALPLLTLRQQMQQAKAAAALAGGGNTNIGAAGDGSFAANNPLNIRFAGQPGAVNTNGFAAWKTPEEGQAATDALFAKYAEGGINTLAGFISRWAPPSENDTAGYIKNVAAATGLDPTAKLDFKDPAVRARVQAAMAVQEGNKNSRRPTAPAAPGAPAATTTTTAPTAHPDTTQPDVAPAAPGNLVAGPGAPSNLVAKPAGPNVPGDVNAIIEGMTKAGADPTTLKPPTAGTPGGSVPSSTQVASTGPTNIPAQTGGLVVPPGVTPPTGVTTPPAPDQPPPPQYPDIKAGDGVIRHPGTFADFHKREYVPPPQTEDFNPNLTPLQTKAFDIKAAELALKAKQIGTLPVAEQPKAYLALTEARANLEAERQTAAQAKAAAAAAATTKYETEERNKIQDRYKEAFTAYGTAAQARLAHEQELAKQAQQGDIQSRNSKETADLTSRGKVLDQLNKDAVDSRGAVSELDGLASLSNNVDKPSVFATLKIGDTTVLNRLAQAGIVNADQAGATQLLQTGISNAVARLRSGMSMGALSDRDLGFIESMAPNMYENKQTRAAVISYLRRAQDQKNRYNIEVNKLVADGKPISEALQTASETIEQKYPIVPARSQELGDHWLDPDPFWKKKRQDWAAEHNIRPGTMFRRADGGLEVIYSPGMQPVRQAVDVGGPR